MPLGENGNGGVGGCRYKCTRSNLYESRMQCVRILGIWVDKERRTRRTWLNDLKNDICESRQNGFSPSTKNSSGRELNEKIQSDNTKSLLYDYQIEHMQSGYTDFYPSFYRSLENSFHNIFKIKIIIFSLQLFDLKCITIFEKIHKK